MDIRAFPYTKIVKLKKNQEMPYIYDVELDNINQLKSYSSVECHIILYPYSRKICADNFTFNPFEEYARDILTNQRSAYSKRVSQFNKLFGLSLVLILVAFFAVWKPVSLFSVECLVSILWAYLIGKELGDDFEKLLIEKSKRLKVRYTDVYYPYELEKNTTLTLYSRFAKKQRYGKVAILPARFDFIEQSNSQAVHMRFNKDDLKAFNGTIAHLLSIHVDPQLLSDFEKNSFMLSVKLSFNKGVFGCNRCFEFFQSIDKGRCGCLDEKGEWRADTIFYRKTLTAGRIKYYMTKGFLPNETMIT